MQLSRVVVRAFLPALAAALLLPLTACPSAGTGGSSQPTTDEPADTAKPDDEDEPQPTIETGASNEGEGGGEGGSVPGPTLPVGALCDSAADCAAGEVCEGQGCGPKGGRCMSAQRMCTRDLQTYCGCDGNEFGGSGTCPGDRYAYRGACAPQLVVGEPCTDGRQCSSGLCMGAGLEGCSRGSGGVCAEPGTGCTKDLATYCGCNGVEFRASGSCPNQQFAYRGPCEG